MKVSFLVTYFNQEQFVAQSMDSILAIDKPDEWEILVGDDGSSDGTVDIIKSYIKKYPNNIFLYVMPREKEVAYDAVQRASANRINLLEHCSGDCFCTLDGDDFFFDTSFISEAIEVFQQNKEISIVLFGFRYFRNGKFEEEKVISNYENQSVNIKNYLCDLYMPAGACVHRILWEQKRVEYIKQIGFYDDNDIIINGLNYGAMYNIPRAIYAYRQTGESTFTRMKQFEQSVLNVQGYDVDKKLIEDSYWKYLIVRNMFAILHMYCFRYKAEKELGEKKYSKYIQGCKKEKESICRCLLCYPLISGKEKKAIRKLIISLFYLNPKRAIKNLLMIRFHHI